MAMTAEDQATAAELALGLSEAEERAAALRRALAEPGFAAAVEEWRARFAALFAAYPEVEPPAWIERRLIGITDGARRWRWATGAASLLAASFALALVLQPADVPTPAPQPRPTVAPPVTFAAAMTPAEGDRAAAFAALFDASRGQVRVPTRIDVPADRVAQLWRIGADGVPHSLGLLAARGTTALTLNATDRAALAAGATLAISIEPLGGSPTKLPTGPVVATGALTRI
jgi:anti-sigma-K factor RskA